MFKRKKVTRYKCHAVVIHAASAEEAASISLKLMEAGIKGLRIFESGDTIPYCEVDDV